jgi:hypothetical protein
VSLYRLYTEPGKDGYPPEWHEVLKHQVRAVANNRCVRCHHPYVVGETPGEWSPCDEECTHGGEVRYARDRDLNGWSVATLPSVITAGAVAAAGWEEVEAHWRVLTVHHLDGNKLNCRWWNLVALCQRCHLEIQGKVKMERRWLYEHSEWFKPYVAAYYAITALGEDLSRAEVEARLEELLALEERQMAITLEGTMKAKPRLREEGK